MTEADTLARVDEAIANGSLWKAKEILHGNVDSAHGYRPLFYEKYGQVLLQMGDLIEAGKYLFLSGKRLPAYQEAIALYLKRHSKSNPFTIIRTFPKAARLQNLSDYPESVHQYLRSLGHTDSTLQNCPPQGFKQCHLGSPLGICCIVFLLFLFVLLAYLIWYICSSLFHLFTSP